MARNSRQIIPSFMKDLTLKTELFDVLKDANLPSFTVHELTEIYLNHPSSLHSSKKSARQFVYRNMKRLMKLGHMERLKTDRGWPQYALTEQFLRFVKSSTGAASNFVPSEAPHVAKADPLMSLKERLKIHQAEVLTAMGEMEEYETICQELPDLREIAQPRYNESRERCSRILGRVKALESLLAAEAG